MAPKNKAEDLVISNRDEAIPVIAVTPSSSPGKDQSTKERIKSSPAATKIREKLHIENKKLESSRSMQDRLVNVYVVVFLLLFTLEKPSFLEYFPGHLGFNVTSHFPSLQYFISLAFCIFNFLRSGIATSGPLIPC
jgi:hypothetical protein